jgi:hypothetical protein
MFPNFLGQPLCEMHNNEVRGNNLFIISAIISITFATAEV